MSEATPETRFEEAIDKFAEAQPAGLELEISAENVGYPAERPNPNEWQERAEGFVRRDPTEEQKEAKRRAIPDRRD